MSINIGSGEVIMAAVVFCALIINVCFTFIGIANKSKKVYKRLNTIFKRRERINGRIETFCSAHIDLI